MEPNAKNQDLLYVSDEQTCDVYVFSYREGNLVGTLTSGIGFNAPGGECVDKRGDIFITNGNATNILEFAHGGTTPIERLKDARGGPARMRGRSKDGRSGRYELGEAATARECTLERRDLQRCDGEHSAGVYRTGL